MLNLTLRQLRYVLAIAETGSIAAAARECRISQSSVLAALGIAEVDAGALLFERRPSKGVSTTPTGERFVLAAKLLLEAEAEFQRKLDHNGDDTPPLLRIGCFESFGAVFMPDLLRQFSQGRNVEVHLREGGQPQLLRWLETNAVDAIVTYDIGIGLPETKTVLTVAPPHLLLHRDNQVAKKQTISLADVVDLPMVLLDLPDTSAYLLGLFDIIGQRPRVAFTARSYQAVRAAVSCGFGFSILNMKPIGRGSADSDDLQRRDLLDELPAPQIVIADKYGSAKPAFLGRFIDVAHEFFRQHQ